MPERTSFPSASRPKNWLRAIGCTTDPAVVKARQCLREMGRRYSQAEGQPLRLTVEVLETDYPWAGVIDEDASRPRSSMFVTRGLVNRLATEELIAVMGHEWGHIADKRAAAEWALRGAGVSATLGLHGLGLSILLGDPGLAGTWWVSLLILTLTVVLMGACLTWERKAKHWQELACDRFAAQLVGARTMVSTLRRVDALMKRHTPCSMPRRSLMAMMGSTHPSVEERVWNIVRHRHQLKGQP